MTTTFTSALDFSMRCFNEHALIKSQNTVYAFSIILIFVLRTKHFQNNTDNIVATVENFSQNKKKYNLQILPPQRETTDTLQLTGFNRPHYLKKEGLESDR